MTTRRPTRRAAIIAGAAGLAVIGAVGVGAAAFADGTPSGAATAMPAPSGAPSGAPGGQAGHGPDGTHSPHIGGSVLTVSGSTVTVKDRDGFTRTIRLASGVKVTKSGSTSSVSAITKGTWIEATGTVDADKTTLDATSVSIGMPTPPNGGPGRGGFGGGPRGERPSGSGEAPTTAPSTAS